jgi:agmatine deiminase
MSATKSFHLPPEWGVQEWLWIGFPHDVAEWPGTLEAAQEQIAAFANAVAESSEEVRLLVRDEANEARAKSLVNAKVMLERCTYGDIWLRDTGPLVVSDGTGNRIAKRFGFNGWGGRYLMDGDETIGAELAVDAGLPVERAQWILEGGAIDGDGTGLVVTTEQCLLNLNRNPLLTRDVIEAKLRHDLGFDRVLWLGDGLLGDHTDGHVDNLARFVAPGVLALPRSSDAGDPNAASYADARQRATAIGLEIRDIPSAGGTAASGGEPASYMNFVITNAIVVVPTFGGPHDAEAVAAIGECFPDRETIGLPADAVLAGGGGFHCASREMPAA